MELKRILEIASGQAVPTTQLEATTVAHFERALNVPVGEPFHMYQSLRLLAGTIHGEALRLKLEQACTSHINNAANSVPELCVRCESLEQLKEQLVPTVLSMLNKSLGEFGLEKTPEDTNRLARFWLNSYLETTDPTDCKVWMKQLGQKMFDLLQHDTALPLYIFSESELR